MGILKEVLISTLKFVNIFVRSKCNFKFFNAEIKDSKILSEFTDCIPKEDKVSEAHSPIMGFKKRRVGVSTNPSTLGLSGLQLLTSRCHDVEEIELGYSSKYEQLFPALAAAQID